MADRPLKIPVILDRGVWDVAPMVDAFGVETCCLDLDGRFTYISPAGQALLRRDADELAARTIFRARISTGCAGGPAGAGRRLPGVQH